METTWACSSRVKTNSLMLFSLWQIITSQHIQVIDPLLQRYSGQKIDEPERLNRTLFEGTRSGSLSLIRDLHDLWLLANEVHLCWVILWQAALALRDNELERACKECDKETSRQLAFLLTRIKQSAPQSLVVAE